MKENKLRYVLVCLIIFAIIVAIILFKVFKGNSEKPTGKEYIFSDYKFIVPGNLNYVDYDKNHFKIEGNGWHAIVSLFYDIGNTMDDVEKIYYDIRDSIDGATKNVSVSTIKGRDTLVFDLYEENYVLCYFGTNWNFEYEVQLYNDDSSYSLDALDSFMDSLQTAEYVK